MARLGRSQPTPRYIVKPGVVDPHYILGANPVVITLGSVAMSGSAGMTVGSLVTDQASISMSATSVETVAAVDTAVAVVAMHGAASATVSAVDTALAAVHMTATTAVSITGKDTALASITMHATTTLTETVIIGVAMALSATTSLTVAAKVSTTGTISLAATAALVPVGAVYPPGRYWVLGTGTWDGVTTTHWSTYSGGPSGASVPTSSDDVYFDGNSSGGTTTVSATVPCHSLNATGFTGTINIPTNSIQVWGPAVTLGATMTTGITGASVIIQSSTIITCNGKSIQTLGFSGVGITVQQADALLLTGGLTVTNGTWLTNNFNATMASFNSSNTNVRTLTLGSSSITLTGAGGGGLPWNTGTSNNLTVTANTATITMTDSNANFATGNVNWNGATIVFTPVGNGTSVVAATSGSTFGNVIMNGFAGKTGALSFTGPATITNTLTVNGNSVLNRILVQSNTVGSSRTITAANVVTANTDWQDITGAGAADWDLSAITGNSGDCGGNSGIIFTPAMTNYWVSPGAAGNFSDITKWASSSGGAASSGRVPLAQDSVRFDANSFTSSTSVTTDMPRIGKDIDWTGATNSPVWGHSSMPFASFGSVKMISAMTFSGTQTWTLAGRGTHTFTSAGMVITMSLIVNGPGGSYTLGDAFSSSNIGVTVTNGMFATNGFNYIAPGLLPGAGSGVRTVDLGTSIVTLTATGGSAFGFNGATNLTINAVNSTIVFTGAAPAWNGGAVISGTGFGTVRWASTVTGIVQMNMTGANYSIGMVDFIGSGSAELQIQNAMTFGVMQIAPGRSLRLPQIVVTTVGAWNVTGSAGNLITLYSSVAGSPALLRPTSGATTPFISDYLAIKDITAQDPSGGSGVGLWYAGDNSVNNGNNTGWLFNALIIGVLAMAASAGMSVIPSDTELATTHMSATAGLTVAAQTFILAVLTMVANGTLTVEAGVILVAGMFKVWDGATWQISTPRAWDGVQWVDAVIRVWDGATWKMVR